MQSKDQTCFFFRAHLAGLTIVRPKAAMAESIRMAGFKTITPCAKIKKAYLRGEQVDEWWHASMSPPTSPSPVPRQRGKRVQLVKVLSSPQQDWSFRKTLISSHHPKATPARQTKEVSNRPTLTTLKRGGALASLDDCVFFSCCTAEQRCRAKRYFLIFTV